VLLTIKVKLIPDGKEKYLNRERKSQNDDETTSLLDDASVIFPSIQKEKLHEKSLLISVSGKGEGKQRRKSHHFGHIGPFMLSDVNNKLLTESDLGGGEVNCLHEIEKKKMSTIEVLVQLQKKDGYLSVEVVRIKGVKVDQKNLDNTLYIQTMLLDKYRFMSSRQTKSYRQQSSTITFNEKYDFPLYGLHLDQCIIILNLFQTTAGTGENKITKSLARIKLASALYCSGNSTVHWNQFITRQSFSMWHTMVKD